MRFIAPSYAFCVTDLHEVFYCGCVQVACVGEGREAHLPSLRHTLLCAGCRSARERAGHLGLGAGCAPDFAAEHMSLLLLHHSSSSSPAVFVETLDKTFENVCELDLIFHVDRVHYVLDEIVLGGMVLETNINEIMASVTEMNRLEQATRKAATKS